MNKLIFLISMKNNHMIKKVNQIIKLIIMMMIKKKNQNGEKQKLKLIIQKNQILEKNQIYQHTLKKHKNNLQKIKNQFTLNIKKKIKLKNQNMKINKNQSK